MKPSYSPNRVLVTGGAGFIGANFIHYLLRSDPEVRIVNLDLLTYAGSLTHLDGLVDPQRHHFVQGDICDRALIERLLLDHDIDTVVHFAAETHVDRSITGPAAFVQTNLVGTWTLLECCRLFWLQQRQWQPDQCRFHHVSTDEVYGSLTANDPPCHEETLYRPNSPYSAAKAGSDHLVRAYHHTYGLPATQTNCSNNYGPRQHGEKLIPTVIRTCLASEPIPVYGNGRNVRDWLYVSDHCSGIDTVVRRAAVGTSYNIGASNEWANIDLIHRICVILDRLHPSGAPHERLIHFVTDRPGHDWRYSLDSSKLEQQLGWAPQVAFDDGLEQTIRWYMQL
ncbi:MAG: dTDP-glucose 4,6-dehydratase [Magnetococcales bacterium]|nr:dTDP-glucose 4,6-dehydratase [Magnetococcales bacterium]